MSRVGRIVAIVLGTLIVWMLGSFGIGTLWDALIQDGDTATLMSFFTGMAWGCITVLGAMLAWDRWVDAR